MWFWAILAIVLLSWVQYLYVRAPRARYVWSSSIVIPAIVIHLFGLWTEGWWVLGLFLIGGIVQWVLYWLLFRRFPVRE